MKPYKHGETHPAERARLWMEYLKALHAADKFVTGVNDYFPSIYLSLMEEIGYVGQGDEEIAAEKVQNLAYQDVTVEVKQSYHFNADGSKRSATWHYEARLNEPGVPEKEQVRIIGIFRDGGVLDGSAATVMVPEFETARFVMFRPDTKAEREAMDWFARNLDETD